MNEYRTFGPFQIVTGFVTRAELLPLCIEIRTFDKPMKSLTYHEFSPNMPT
ncbi:MAG: hypothetical protein ACXV2E_04725 [Halobacteriota archaeon]